MSVHCLKSDALPSLMHSLQRKLPASLAVYSAIRLIDNGPLDGFRVYTDDWPEYSAVVVSADKAVVKNPYLQRSTLTFCESKHGLRKIITHAGTVDVINTFLIAASRESTRVFDEVFHDVTGSWPKPSPCDFYPCIMNELPATHVTSPCPLPSDIKEDVLNEEAVNAMDAVWKFSEPGTLDFMKSMVSSGKILSVCLYDKQDTPIAWSMEQLYGSIGMTFVKPEHRRRGFGKNVTLRLAEKLKARDGRVYACMEPSNSISNKMHEDLGFQRVKIPCSEMLWKRYFQNKIACNQTCSS